MMDWTDTHCRVFHRLLAPDVRLYTEMVHANAVIHGDRGRLLAMDASEHPVALQLGGSEPDALREAVRVAVGLGFDEVNLNCGCPSDRVQAGRFGACLMREPALVAECVAAMIEGAGAGAGADPTGLRRGHDARQAAAMARDPGSSTVASAHAQTDGAQGRAGVRVGSAAASAADAPGSTRIACGDAGPAHAPDHAAVKGEADKPVHAPDHVALEGEAAWRGPGRPVASAPVPITVKCRLGVDDDDDFEQFLAFVDTITAAGCNTVVVHARNAWLKGLSPKENREVPPLRYEWAYRLKQLRPALDIHLNGGIATVDDCVEHLRHVDGVMLGRAAYHDPYLLHRLHAHMHGAPLQSRDALLRALRPYVERQLAAGVPVKHITRHVLGLYAGQPGGRAFRQVLSEGAHKAGADWALVEAAIAATHRPERAAQTA